MVPFSFENITRSATRDASHVFPISEAARATHESFASYLQQTSVASVVAPLERPAPRTERNAETPIATSPPPRNEPKREDGTAAERDEPPASDADKSTTNTATSASAETEEQVDDRSDPNINHQDKDDGNSETSNAAVASAEPQAEVRLVEAESVGESPDEANAADEESPSQAKSRQAVSQPDTRPEPAAESLKSETLVESESDAPNEGKTREVRGTSPDTADAASDGRQLNLSTPEADGAAGPLAESAGHDAARSADDASPPADSKSPRRGQRGERIPQPTIPATPEVAPKPIAAGLAETSDGGTAGDAPPPIPRPQTIEAGKPAAGAATPDVTTAPVPGTPSRFAQHLMGRGEDPSGRAATITHAEQGRFVDRVARAVQATGDRGGTLKLRLSPPELGSLTLEVKVQGGVVNARVEADTQAARSLLLENLPLLRERLAEYGMRVDQFDVDLSDRHAGGTPDDLHQNHQQHDNQSRAKTNLRSSEDPSQSITNETTITSGNEQLNIIV